MRRELRRHIRRWVCLWSLVGCLVLVAGAVLASGVVGQVQLIGAAFLAPQPAVARDAGSSVLTAQQPAHGGATSAGCGELPPTPPGTTARATLLSGGVRRMYRLHVPAAYAVNTPIPLVLSFHGHDAGAAAQEWTTGFSRAADAHDFLVVYPQGVVGPDGYTGWNTHRRIDPVANDVLFVRTLLARVEGQVCVNLQRVYATGFSNGGGFTALLACDLADRIAAFAPVSGDYYPQPGGCHPARPVSILELHGTADPMNPYTGSAAKGYPAVSAWLQAWALRDGCAPAPTLLSVTRAIVAERWQRCRDGVVVLHYRLLGGHHVWPQATAFNAMVRPGDDFDATTMIWSFFASLRLPPPQAAPVPTLTAGANTHAPTAPKRRTSLAGALTRRDTRASLSAHA